MLPTLISSSPLPARITWVAWWSLALCGFAGGWPLALAQGTAPGAPPKLTPLPHPDIAPPEPPAAGLPWWLTLALVLLLTLLVALVIWLLFKSPATRPKPPDLPGKRALERLAELQSLASQLPPGETAHRVSVILRDYQLGRYELPAPWRTTEELYGHIRETPYAGLPQRFLPVAETYDRLAFATQAATPADATRLIETAAHILREDSVQGSTARSTPAEPSPPVSPPLSS